MGGFGEEDIKTLGAPETGSSDTATGNAGGSGNSPADGASDAGQQAQTSGGDSGTPLQQLMAVKTGLGLDKSVPPDALGNPIYNTVVTPYGATYSTGSPQAGTVSGDGLSPRPPLSDRLGFDPDKTVADVAKDYTTVEPTMADKMTDAARWWAYRGKTPEETQERIKAPFKPVGEVSDGFFSLPVDDPKEYDSKSGLWQFGREVGGFTPMWDSTRQYGQLATDIQLRDLNGEPVSDEERMRAEMYRNKFLFEGGLTAAEGLVSGYKLYKLLK